MDINAASRLFEEIETWFTEAGFSIVKETEKLKEPHTENYLAFLSKTQREGTVADVIAALIYKYERMMLLIRFHVKVAPSQMREVMKFINVMNAATWSTFWVIIEKESIVECRTAYMPWRWKIDKKSFMKVLEDLLEGAYEQYEYIRRLVENGENVLALSEEFLRETVPESKRERNHKE